MNATWDRPSWSGALDFRGSGRRGRSLKVATALIFASIVMLVLWSRAASSLAAPPLVTAGPSRLLITESGLNATYVHRVVSSQKTINRAVDELNALPLFPARGPVHCPADRGYSYVLSFRYQSRAREVVRVDPTGCEVVTRKGRHPRWTMTMQHPAILRLLDRIAWPLG